ncbi:leucine-rich repeat domain-containing protein [Methanomethylophilus alvi]|uniref:leucine-rich repeat domain-containing protein n=2 Tax=Methanomethylophilus alvi TaxID=1291540 RepID=UPI0037DC912E
MNWKFTLFAVLVMVSVSAYAVVSECSDGSEAASDHSGSCGDNVRYVFDSSTGTLTISGSGDMSSYSYGSAPWYTYRSDVKKVVIGDGVTSIGSYTFYECSSLASVVIPDSVTSIGNYAFYRCTSLASVTIPDSVTSIDSSAFSGCSSLASITIPDSVTSIGNEAFYGCSSLVSVTIPDSVTSIGGDVFSGCSSLTSIIVSEGNEAYRSVDGVLFSKDMKMLVQCLAGKSDDSYIIPDSVTSIGGGAFSGCSSLVSVTIPDSVTSIGQSAFFGCFSLVSVTIPDSVTSIGQFAFYECSSLASVTIPDSVTSIGSDAFFGCSSLTSITIPDGVTSIGGWAFYRCTSLASVVIGNGVTSIGDYAFYRCTSLASITIPDGVTSIGSYAFYECTGLRELTIPISVNAVGSNDSPIFYGCTNIEKVTFTPGTGKGYDYGTDSFSPYGNYYGYTPWHYSRAVLKEVVIEDGVTSIGDYAFSGCSSLASITIPDGVTSIGDDAFYRCSSLASVVIGNGVTSIGSGTFYGCSSLVSLTVDEGNEAYRSVDGVLFSKDMKMLVQYPAGRSDDQYVIPDSVTSIGSNAFYGCSSLASVTIPDGVTSIGSNAFSGCSSLASITIPDGVTSIGSNAFSGCSSLASITIPDGVTSIGSSAFRYCIGLKELTIPISVNAVGSNSSPIFYGCTNIEKVTFTPGTGKGYDYGTGSSSSYRGYYGYTPWYYSRAVLKEVVIEDGVTSIGSNAFSGCSSLASVTIPDSVTSIGSNAFYGCSSLASVTIPDSVTSIDSSAFSGCSSLASITIPDGVTSIGDDAFYRCSSLASVTIPDSVTSIGGSAFYGCSSLVSVAIPDSVTSIGGSAFYGCSSLVSVAIPDSVTSIGYSAFSGCTRLKELTIPISVNAVGSNSYPVFSGCTNIEKVTFTPGTGKGYGYGTDSSLSYDNYYSYTPWYYSRAVLKEVVIEDGVTSIGSYAFRDCTGLRELIIGNGVTSIGSGTFYGCSSLVSVTIPDGVTSIGNYAFEGCSSLVSVTIPDGVVSICYSVFEKCTSLVSVTIPDGVASIDHRAFYGCSSLTSIILPDIVTSIGQYAFYGCTDVSSIRIGPDVSSIGYKAFGDIVFYDKDATSVLSSDADSLKGGCFVKTDDRMVKVDGHMMSFYVDGKVVYRGVFVEGDEDTHIPDVPFRPGYICSWEEFELGTEDVSVNAAYVLKSYHVEFVFDGILFFAYDLEYGKEITLPSGIPSKDADGSYTYAFSGWDGYTEDMTVDGDRVFNALFSRSVIANTGEDGGYEVKADGEGAPFSSETISGIVDGASADPSVTLSVSVGDTLVSFDNEALRNLHGDDADLLVSRLSYGQMTQAVRDVVGDNVAYSISFGPNRSFGNGTVTVTIPYVLAEGKDPDNLVVYYVAEDGAVEEIPCTYSEGYVTFSTDHFSVYAVMYEEPPSDGGPSDSMTVFAVIGIVIAVGAVGVGAMMFVKKKRA